MVKEPLPPSLRDAILTRTLRVRHSIFIGGVVLAVLFGATILLRVFRAPDLYLANAGEIRATLFLFVWQVGGILVMFWIGSSIPYARARAMVLHGSFVFGWPVAERRTFGADVAMRKHGPVGVVAAAAAIAGASEALSNRFPSFQEGWILPWKGKTRWADVWFYEGEEPFLTDDGRGLFLVDHIAWFYPPSPWLLRAVPGSATECELREFVDRMHTRGKSGESIPDAGEGPEQAARRARAVVGRWVAAFVLAVVVLYMPIFLDFGWIMVGLMTLGILVPIFVLGPILRGIDFSGLIPGKRP